MSSSSPAKQGVSAKVIRGGGWMYARMLLTNVLNLGVMAILARKLQPADFGLVALATVIVKFLTVLGTEGIHQFIVHDHKEGWEKRMQAAFWMDLLLACICTAIGLLCLPLVASFFEEPRLEMVLFVILFFFPIRSITKVPDALLRKQLDFKKIEIRDGILEIFTAILSVVMVLTGWGVWSIILPGIIGSIVRLFVLFGITPWRPELSLHLNLWPQIFRYYANIIGTAITTFIISDGDTLLIGKFLGSKILGIYNLAWQSSLMVNKTIVGLATRMALPALSAVAKDPLRVKSAIFRMMKVLSIISFPAFVGFFVLADDFILVVYGPQWTDAVLPLRILLIFAMRYAVNPPIGAYFQAIGRPDVNFKLGLAMVPLYLAAIWVGSYWGIVGVAAGVTIVRTVFGLVAFEIAARFLKVGFKEILAPLGPALLASVIMGLVVYIIKLSISPFLTDLRIVQLLLLVLTGGAVYLALLRTRYNDLARELGKLLEPILGKYNKKVYSLLNIQPART